MCSKKPKLTMEKEIEGMPKSSPTGYFFPWNNVSGDFDISSYQSSYSEGLVTPKMLDKMIAGLRKTGYYPRTDHCGCLLLYTAILILVVGLLVSGLSPIFTYQAGPGAFFSTLFGGIILTLVVGSCLMYTAISRICKRAEVRRQKLARALIDFVETDLQGFHTKVYLSPAGGYIAMEFKWKDYIDEEVAKIHRQAIIPGPPAPIPYNANPLIPFIAVEGIDINQNPAQIDPRLYAVPYPNEVV